MKARPQKYHRWVKSRSRVVRMRVISTKVQSCPTLADLYPISLNLPPTLSFCFDLVNISRLHCASRAYHTSFIQPVTPKSTTMATRRTLLLCVNDIKTASCSNVNTLLPRRLLVRQSNIRPCVSRQRDVRYFSSSRLRWHEAGDQPVIDRTRSKVFKDADEAVADLKSGSTLFSAGFGLCGTAGTRSILLNGTNVLNTDGPCQKRLLPLSTGVGLIH